ncbi:MAG: peptidoglycan D,D-transpeptidase FtsI family protein [Rhodospirillaceae bacterium]
MKKQRPFLYPGEEVRPAGQGKLRLHGMTMHAIETGRMRLFVTAGLFALSFAAIGLRLVDLMLVTGGSSARTARAASAPAPLSSRADIVDRNGVIVATNLPTVNLYADAQKVPDARAATEKLLKVLPELKYDDVLRRLASGQRFIYLARHLTPQQQQEVNDLGIPGFAFEAAQRRIYPHGSLFSHVIGATDADNIGVAGIERTFNETLTQDSAPLRLSLDVRVQHVVRETLAASISRYRALAGSAVVMDVRNGEIVSLVSLPDFDPKAMGTASTDARFNRATLGLYEMGSTFKLFTAAMALEEGTANLNSTYDASQPIKIGRFSIDDFHGLNRVVTVPEILIHSSNIGAAKMALAAGTDVQKIYMKKLGLMSPLKLELPEVGTPQYPQTWREINTITVSYGHGIAVTPVHVVSGVSALVNGGTLFDATLIRRNGPAEGTRVLSAKTSLAMRALMRLIVVDGSGRQADAPGYLVGGKTGTPEKLTYRGGYNQSSLHPSFVGAFPIDDPQYVILVMLDEPKGTRETAGFATAGWNSAPTVGRIVNQIGPMLGVYPMGHTESFEPLASLLPLYNGNSNEYAAPIVKAVDTRTAPPAPVKTALPVDTSPADDIGELIERAPQTEGAGATQ